MESSTQVTVIPDSYSSSEQMSLRLSASGSDTNTRIGSAGVDALASLSRISTKEPKGRFQATVKNEVKSSALRKRRVMGALSAVSAMPVFPLATNPHHWLPA